MKKIASRALAALVVVAGLFLLVVSIEPNLVRSEARDVIESAPGGSQASGARAPTNLLAHKAQQVLVPTFVSNEPALPLNYRRLEGARHAKDDEYAKWLESIPRTGPTPKNLGELPDTAEMVAKRREFGNGSELDYRLRMLDAINDCAKQAHVAEGSIAAVLWFQIEGNVAKPHRVTYEASTIKPSDMTAVTSCIHQAHVSSGGFALKPEPGMSEHVWPTTITIPVRNHEMYHWLDGREGAEP